MRLSEIAQQATALFGFQDAPPAALIRWMKMIEAHAPPEDMIELPEYTDSEGHKQQYGRGIRDVCELSIDLARTAGHKIANELTKRSSDPQSSDRTPPNPYLDLLDSVRKKLGDMTIKAWLKFNNHRRIDPTVFFRWKKSGGRPIKGHLSQTMVNEIARAIEKSAESAGISPAEFFRCR
jgi:hypothetical protein